MKKVLIVTYYWPPAGGPGVQRFVKFAKYLPTFNWEPVILTTQDGSYHAMDSSLDKDLPDHVKVFRVRSWEPHALYNRLKGKKSKEVEEMMGNLKSSKNVRYELISNWIRANLFVPDARRGWNIQAKRRAHQLVKAEQIDAVVTTGPPHSTHLIGLSLKRRLGLPWIADFRDPWTSIMYNQLLKRTKWAEQWDKGLEHKVLKYCDALSVVGEGMQAEFSTGHNQVEILYNGFDDADFIGDTPRRMSKFQMSYVGNFKVLQNYPPFWNALGKALQTNKISTDQFEFNFVGNVNEHAQKSIMESEIAPYVVYSGYKNHDQAVEIMKQSDLLFFINSQIPDNYKYISGKIFEYLATQNPILAIGPKNGNVDNILKRCQYPGIFDYEELDQIVNFFLDIYRSWSTSEKEIRWGDREKIHQFTRKFQTKKLVDLLNEHVKS